MAQLNSRPQWPELASSLNSSDPRKCLKSMVFIHDVMTSRQNYVRTVGELAGWEPILIMIVNAATSYDCDHEKRIRLGVEALEMLANADDKYLSGILCFFAAYPIHDTVRKAVVQYLIKYGADGGDLKVEIWEHFGTEPGRNRRRHVPKAKVHEDEEQSEIKDAQDDGSDDDNAQNTSRKPPVGSYGGDIEAESSAEPSAEPSVGPSEYTAPPRSGRPGKRKRAHAQENIPEHLGYKKHSLSIFIGTWNVAAKKPKGDIASWLFPRMPHNGVAADADIFALGLQEIVPLDNVTGAINVTGAKRLLRMTSNPSSACEAWEKAIADTLAEQCPDTSYCLVATHHLVGVMLCVFAKSNLCKNISNVMMGKKGVGVGDVAGNKGGVGIRMKIFNSEVCFVCSHLEAHKNAVDERNKDYHAIIEELRFAPCGDDQSATSKKVEEHDTIFWLGDLNYRLNHDCLRKVKTMVEKGQCESDFFSSDEWKELFAFDQLDAERNAGRAFEGFKEHPITFCPTYKFEPDTSNYSFGKTLSGYKKLLSLARSGVNTVSERFPAWCDRILWRCGRKVEKVECVRYESSMEQEMSDHKPVFAVMRYEASEFNVPDKNID